MDSVKILRISSTQKIEIERYDPAVYDKMVNVRVTKQYGLEVDEENALNKEFFMKFDELNRRLPKNLPYFSKTCIADIGCWAVK